MSATIHLDRREDDTWTADDVQYAEEPRFTSASLQELSEAVQEAEGAQNPLEVEPALGEEVAVLVTAARSARGDTRQRLLAELAEHPRAIGLTDADVHTLVEGF